MSNMKNIPVKIYLQIGDECDSEDFNELSEVSWCRDKIYDNDIEFALQNQMDNITEKEIKNLEDILLYFSEAHNMLAKTSLSKEEYQPISGLLAKAKVELFNFCNNHKAALQNKVSDVNAEKIKQRILEAYYDGFNQAHYSHVHPEICEPKECGSAGKEYMIKKEKLINSDLEEYASIVNERKDNAGINDAIEFADWINKNASRNAVGSWGYFGNMFYTKTSKELYDIFKSESQPQQKEVDGYDDEMPPL